MPPRAAEPGQPDGTRTSRRMPGRARPKARRWPEDSKPMERCAWLNWGDRPRGRGRPAPGGSRRGRPRAAAARKVLYRPSGVSTVAGTPTGWAGVIRIFAPWLLPVSLPALLMIASAAAAQAPAASGATQGAPATAAAEPAAPLAAGELEDLIRVLEDPAQRDRLIAALRAAQAAPAEQPAQDELLSPDRVASVLAEVVERTEVVRRVSSSIVATLDQIPRLFEWLQAQLGDPTQRAVWLSVGLRVAASIGFAAFAYFGVALALRPVRKRLTEKVEDSALGRGLGLLAILLLDLLPVLAFVLAIGAVVLFISLTGITPSAEAQAVARPVIQAVILAWVSVALARLIFAPEAPALRLLLDLGCRRGAWLPLDAPADRDRDLRLFRARGRPRARPAVDHPCVPAPRLVLHRRGHADHADRALPRPGRARDREPRGGAARSPDPAPALARAGGHLASARGVLRPLGLRGLGAQDPRRLPAAAGRDRGQRAGPGRLLARAAPDRPAVQPRAAGPSRGRGAALPARAAHRPLPADRRRHPARARVARRRRGAARHLGLRHVRLAAQRRRPEHREPPLDGRAGRRRDDRHLGGGQPDDRARDRGPGRGGQSAPQQPHPHAPQHHPQRRCWCS